MAEAQRSKTQGPRSGKPEKSLALSLQNIYETLVISWPTVVDAFAGRVTMQECDDRLASWAAEIAKNAAYELEVVGRENLGTRGEAFLVMSNHQSLYDVPVIFHVLGGNLRMITKTELFKVPVFGPAMKHAGFISIDRSNRERAMKSLEIAKEKIAGGLNVWIAPEGTRSKTGALLPFKKGGSTSPSKRGCAFCPSRCPGRATSSRQRGRARTTTRTFGPRFTPRSTRERTPGRGSRPGARRS